MTSRYALALLALVACTQVRDATLTHSGAQTTPAPCVVGEARCRGRIAEVCGRARFWPVTPSGTTCRFACVTDAHGPHCAGPLDAGVVDDVTLVVSETPDDAGHVEDTPAVEVMVLPVTSPDDAGE